MKESIREKINKDDGKHFQVGNHDLNAKEIIGFSLMILAMLVYLLVDKTGFEHAWLGWIFLVAGFVLTVLGFAQNEQ